MRVREAIKARMQEKKIKGRVIIARFSPPRSDGWISNVIAGRQAVALEDLDTVAAAIGLPPAALVKEPGSALEELRPSEARIVRALRELPPVVRDHMMIITEYLIGALPAEMPQTVEDVRLWRKVRRLSPSERADVAKTIEETLTARRRDTSAGSGPAAPLSSAPTGPATLRDRKGPQQHD